MSWIKDIQELPITIRSVVISILSIIPFWYISIYLFHNSFYHNAFDINDYFIILSFCVCFSITWYCINLIFSAIVIHYINESEKDDDFDSIPILFIGAISSIIYLCVVIIITYIYKWSFIKFISIVYLYIVFRIITTPVGIWFFSPSANKDTDNEKS